MTIAVALSGGIDSLVAAYLLKQQTPDIFGIHFITGYESRRHGNDTPLDFGPGSPASHRPNPQLQQIARQLEIPLHIIDIRKTFEENIVAYFVETYRSGKTPNPCVMCNRIIKFGAALEAARNLGATNLATGHYARIGKKTDRLELLKGADRNKDQSYFLSMLTEKQLSRAIFPLGDLEKNRVHEIAREHDLQPASGRESQDICFIPAQNYGDFLEAREKGVYEPGPIVDTEGNAIGRHKGLHRYTIGQRRGLNCPAAAPYYVVRIDPENNRLVVGFENTLYKETCSISNVNWLIPKPEKPISVRAKIRYRHHEAAAWIEPGPGNSATIRFREPQKAITPGQAAVCYQQEAVAAAGWIEYV